MKRPKRNVTLWSLVETMQSKLEGYGLNERAVDAAVVTSVDTMLRSARGGARYRPTLILSPVAKA